MNNTDFLNKFKVSEIQSNFKYYRRSGTFTFFECWIDHARWDLNVNGNTFSIQEVKAGDFIEFLFDGWEKENPIIKFTLANGDAYHVFKDGIYMITEEERKNELKKFLSFTAAIKLAKAKIKQAESFGNSQPMTCGVNVMERNNFSFDDSGEDKKTKEQWFKYSHPLSGNVEYLRYKPKA